MDEFIRIYGSVFVLVTGGICGLLTVALFVSPSWVIETLGLPGFAIYVTWTLLLPVLSFSFDLVGNARDALPRR